MTVLLGSFLGWFRAHRCHHQWVYRTPGISGWGVVRCARCGGVDIY